MGRGRSNPGSTEWGIAWDIPEQFAEDRSGADAALILSIECLRRESGKLRRYSRLTEPLDLEFDVDSQATPDKFFRGDIRDGVGRHLIFASDEQLEILAGPHTWYGDGAPFERLRPALCPPRLRPRSTRIRQAGAAGLRLDAPSEVGELRGRLGRRARNSARGAVDRLRNGL